MTKVSNSQCLSSRTALTFRVWQYGLKVFAKSSAMDWLEVKDWLPVND